MKVYLILFILLSNVSAFKINHITSKKFPKVSYTKFHDISYRSPIRIRRMEPFVFVLFKQMKKLFTDIIDNYINETYAMASLPLSYTFPVLYNKTLSN
jgi:hypothetical protein